MSLQAADTTDVTGVILAGGMARRMGGGDKGLIEVHHRPLVEYAIDRLRPQVATIIINANNNQERYRRYQYPVIADDTGGYNGPLAGVASCMRRADTGYMLTVPCDAPCFPADLTYRLMLRLRQEDAEICAAHDGARIQPVFSLMKLALLDSLVDYLGGGDRKVDLWFQRHRLALADFSDQPEAFLNINTPDDLVLIESRLQPA